MTKSSIHQFFVLLNIKMFGAVVFVLIDFQPKNLKHFHCNIDIIKLANFFQNKTRYNRNRNNKLLGIDFVIQTLRISNFLNFFHRAFVSEQQTTFFDVFFVKPHQNLENCKFVIKAK